MSEQITSELNYRNGLFTAVIGAIIGLVVYPLVFLDQYVFMMNAEFAKGSADGSLNGIGCMTIVKWYYPAFTDVGVAAGILFVMAIYGFSKKEYWGYQLAITANIMMLMTSFWPMVPAMDTGNFPYFVFIFVPALIMYVVFTKYVKEMPMSRVVFGAVLGMAMITAFMNGIASTQRIITLPDSLYRITQRLNWIAGIMWLIVVIGILLYSNKEWVFQLAVLTILVELLAGYSLGIMMTVAKGAFSMFLLGPLFATVALFVIILKKWDAVVQPDS